MEDSEKSFQISQGRESANNDFVLPPLESTNVKKRKTWNSTEQQKFEKAEQKLKKQQQERNLKLSHDQKLFLQSRLVYRKQNRLRPKPLGRVSPLSIGTKQAVENQNLSLLRETTRRAPFTLPSLSQNVNLEPKEMNKQKSEVETLRSKTPDIKVVRHSRYLRLSQAQEKDILDDIQKQN